MKGSPSSVALAAAALLAAACGGAAPAPAPRLTLSATPEAIPAGGDGVEVTATLSGATGTIDWILVGPGRLSASSGETITYLPPAAVSTPTPAKLTAVGAGLRVAAIIRVTPVAPTPIVEVVPGAPTVIAGDDPLLLSAFLAEGVGAPSWSLAGPGSLSSTSGAQVWYTSPLNVATAASATVTVTAPGYAPGQSVISIQPGPAGTITVAGRVLMTTSVFAPLLDADSARPLQGARVRVTGLATEVTTDIAGAFKFRSVAPPYTVTAVLDGMPSLYAVSYRGLTRADPTILLGGGIAEWSGTVSGRIGGAGDLSFPEATARRDRVTLLSRRAGASSEAVDHDTGEVVLGPLAWSTAPLEAPSTTGDLIVLQDDGGLPSPTFTAFGERRSVEVAARMDRVGQDVVLSPISSGSLSGTVQAPVGSFPSCAASLRWADRPLALWTGQRQVDGASFEVATPVVEGTMLELTCSCLLPDLGESNHRLVRLPASASGLAAVLREPPAMLAPGSFASDVTLATPFSWSPFAGGIHDVHFLIFAGARRVDVDVVTAEPGATIPDLRPFGVGLTYGSTFSSYWWVTGVAPMGSVDVAADAPSTPEERWHASTRMSAFSMRAAP